MKANSPTIQANTLGNIAREYNLQVKTLWTLINANENLKAMVLLYTAGLSRKGKKILPPKVIEEIYNTLGNP